MIKPVLHRILVKPFDIAEVDEVYKRAKSAGLAVPQLEEHSREQAAIDTGVVIDIGETAFKDFGTESPIKIGDTIMYAKYSGKTVTENDERFALLNDEDVIAILVKGA